MDHLDGPTIKQQKLSHEALPESECLTLEDLKELPETEILTTGESSTKQMTHTFKVCEENEEHKSSAAGNAKKRKYDHVLGQGRGEQPVPNDFQESGKAKKVTTPEELQEILMPTLMTLYNQEESLLFRHSVDSSLPHEPKKGQKQRTKRRDSIDDTAVHDNLMDLSVIRKKMESHQYQDPWQYIEDMWLVFDNGWLRKRKTSLAYSYCTKLADLFEQEIEPIMQSLGYCCSSKFVFLPQELSCHGKNLCIIPRDAKYWMYRSNKSGTSCLKTYNYCLLCFSQIPGGTVFVGDGRNEPQTLIKKELFVKVTNDHTENEPFIQCSECKKNLHQICVFHLDGISPEGFRCDSCLKSSGLQRKKNEFRAKSLPQTKLGNFLECRVNLYLKTKGCRNAEVTIRVVSSSKKDCKVKPAMRSRYVASGEFPDSFPYCDKTLFAFQEIDGCDVCFFGMNVQEYGSDCPKPNARRVYLSYLDSVHYFQPKELRTEVYREIIVGYFDYVRQLGYTMVHIWACPPGTGEDYIFHCHPAEQMIPTPKRLRRWYKKVLDKGKEGKIILGYQDILTQSTEDNVTDPSHLPYFDGDFWPEFLEICCRELEETEKNLKTEAVDTSLSSGTNGISEEVILNVCKEPKESEEQKSRLGENSQNALGYLTQNKAAHNANHLTAKIYSALRKHKDDFFVVRLHSSQDASLLAPTKDPDRYINCSIMNSRNEFYKISRENHYEFSTLRRAKYSTMAIIYQFHKSRQQSSVKKRDHTALLQLSLRSFLHANRCTHESCSSFRCNRIKIVFQHKESCKVKAKGVICEEKNCSEQCCSELKVNLRQERLLQALPGSSENAVVTPTSPSEKSEKVKSPQAESEMTTGFSTSGNAQQRPIGVQQDESYSKERSPDLNSSSSLMNDFGEVKISGECVSESHVPLIQNGEFPRDEQEYTSQNETSSSGQHQMHEAPCAEQLSPSVQSSGMPQVHASDYTERRCEPTSSPEKSEKLKSQQTESDVPTTFPALGDKEQSQIGVQQEESHAKKRSPDLNSSSSLMNDFGEVKISGECVSESHVPLIQNGEFPPDEQEYTSQNETSSSGQHQMHESPCAEQLSPSVQSSGMPQVHASYTERRCEPTSSPEKSEKLKSQQTESDVPATFPALGDKEQSQIGVQQEESHAKKRSPDLNSSSSLMNDFGEVKISGECVSESHVPLMQNGEFLPDEQEYTSQNETSSSGQHQMHEAPCAEQLSPSVQSSGMPQVHASDYTERRCEPTSSPEKSEKLKSQQTESDVPTTFPALGDKEQSPLGVQQEESHAKRCYPDTIRSSCLMEGHEEVKTNGEGVSGSQLPLIRNEECSPDNQQHISQNETFSSGQQQTLEPSLAGQFLTSAQSSATPQVHHSNYVQRPFRPTSGCVKRRIKQTFDRAHRRFGRNKRRAPFVPPVQAPPRTQPIETTYNPEVLQKQYPASAPTWTNYFRENNFSPASGPPAATHEVAVNGNTPPHTNAVNGSGMQLFEPAAVNGFSVPPQYHPGVVNGSSLPPPPFHPHAANGFPVPPQYHPGVVNGSSLPPAPFHPHAANGFPVPPQYHPGVVNGSSLPPAPFHPHAANGFPVPPQYHPGAVNGFPVPPQYHPGAVNGSAMALPPFNPYAANGFTMPPQFHPGAPPPFNPYAANGFTMPPQFHPGAVNGFVMPPPQFHPGVPNASVMQLPQFYPGVPSGFAVPPPQFHPGVPNASVMQLPQFYPGVPSGFAVPPPQFHPGAQNGSSMPPPMFLSFTTQQLPAA